MILGSDGNLLISFFHNTFQLEKWADILLSCSGDILCFWDWAVPDHETSKWIQCFAFIHNSHFTGTHIRHKDIQYWLYTSNDLQWLSSSHWLICMATTGHHHSSSKHFPCSWLTYTDHLNCSPRDLHVEILEALIFSGVSEIDCSLPESEAVI